MDVKFFSVILASIFASITALILAYLNYKLSRRIDKSSKKTEMRSQCYIDFVSCVAELSQIAKIKGPAKQEILGRLADAKTRIAVYGDSLVVKELAAFDRKYGKLDTEEACNAFLKIINEMRVDFIGKRDGVELNDLKQVVFGAKPLK